MQTSGISDYFEPSNTPPTSGGRSRSVKSSPVSKVLPVSFEATRVGREGSGFSRGTESGVDPIGSVMDTSDVAYQPKKPRRILLRATVVE